jgi:predicted extracellular nuclease
MPTRGRLFLDTTRDQRAEAPSHSTAHFRSPASPRDAQIPSTGNPVSPANTPTPNRPLTHASSSGSLTETPVKRGRTPSTTITKVDVHKWMEKGSYGDEVLRQSFFDAPKSTGQARTTSTEGASGPAKIGMGGSQESTRAETSVTTESSVVGLVCGRCGAQTQGAKKGSSSVVCQRCKERQ